MSNGPRDTGYTGGDSQADDVPQFIWRGAVVVRTRNPRPKKGLGAELRQEEAGRQRLLRGDFQRPVKTVVELRLRNSMGCGHLNRARLHLLAVTIFSDRGRAAQAQDRIRQVEVVKQ